MAFTKSFTLALCILITQAYGELQSINGKIKITTATGAFCGHTVNFISQQLAPAYEEYGEYLDLEFIPWGRAALNEDGTVTCVQGINDCWANRLHRCVINMLKDDQTAQMKYMNCEFTDRSAFLLGSYACVQDVGLNLVEVDYCVNNPHRDNLDAEAAGVAINILETLNAVPSIVFNERIDQANELYTDARNRLSDMLCSALVEDPVTNITDCN